MKRTQESLKAEKSFITDTLQSIDNIPNNIPAVQKHTYNFKGRKSSDIATALLKELTPQNGTVYDPFDGSNAFGIAAGSANLNFFGSELDNYTFSVNKVLLTRCDFDKVNEFFLQIQSKCQSQIMDLYATECCGKKNYISKLHFDPEGENGFDEPEYYHPTPHRDITNNESIILANPCPVCGAKRKIFEDIDMEKINSKGTAHRIQYNIAEGSAPAAAEMLVYFIGAGYEKY